MWAIQMSESFKTVMIQSESVSRKQQGADIRVDRIVGGRSQTDADGGVNHGEIGHKEKYRKQKPTAVAPMVGEETQSEDGGSFET
jgi:hypothetical protein